MLKQTKQNTQLLKSEEHTSSENPPEKSPETTKPVQEEIPTILPVLPLRDVVIFPHMIFPVLVGREQSLKAVNESLERGKFIFLVAQKGSNVEDPTQNDIYREGTIGKIFQYLKLPNGLMKILVDGIVEADIGKFTKTDSYLEAEVFISTPLHDPSSDLDALVRSATSLFSEYIQLSRNAPPEVLAAFQNIRDVRRKMYFIAANITQNV
ncbi:MAG: LON peptidase substrate-binding domain-containing protein, partial [Ignavibacteriales bacterium]|nr:LON peptidase substrate-binding domain-containing protein [Ignavibacteriales bacterium]